MTNTPAGPTVPGRLLTPTAHLSATPTELAPVTPTFEMRFTSTPRGARLARHLVAVRLDAWGIPYGTNDHEAIVLIVAELAANAVLHGNVPGRDFRFRLALLPTGPRSTTVRVEVSDHPTDPMGDDDIPVFRSGSRIDWSEGRGSYLEGFGA